MEYRVVECCACLFGGSPRIPCKSLPTGALGFAWTVLAVALVCQAKTTELHNSIAGNTTADHGTELQVTTPPEMVADAVTTSQDEKDVVARFLRIVEQYERDKHNCLAGTWFSLGDGVVQQYGVMRFKAPALATVSRANLLTRLWMTLAEQESSDGGGGSRNWHRLTEGDRGNGSSEQPQQPKPATWQPRVNSSSSSSQQLADFLYAQVVNLVESDDDIFAAGNCYDQREFNDYHLFCPYAYRLPSGTSVNTGNSERILVKDLSVEYEYLSNSSDWFYPARQKAEKLVAERNKTINYERLRYNGTVHGKLRNVSAILVRYEDGHWSKPYFDCGGADIWMMTYTVPFFGYKNGEFYFKGTSGIDIDLQKIDINQCPLPPGSNETNVFANSSRCPIETTECSPLSGLGFRRGSYSCICKRGFYFPLLTSETLQRYYNGVLVEHEYEKLTKGQQNQYSTFRCLPCSVGCEECEDSSPCVLTLSWPLRTGLLGTSVAIMCFVPVLAYFIWQHREVKVIKASSPKLMWLTLVGATFMYCPMLVGYFEPSEIVCSARVWLRAVGFSMSYGALLLKTWRISVVFRVRSARTLRISDTDLIKRLGILVLVAAVYVSLRTVWGRPHAAAGRHYSGLKTRQCSYDVWDYCQAGGELLLLLWGIRLCIVVRKAPSEFNESRFISWAIYNETLLSLFLSLAMFFLQSPANPDLLYIIQFIHTNLTTTVTLVFLFGSKAYVVYRRKQRESTATKDDVVLKSKNSTNFRYTKTHKTSFNNESSGNDVSLLYKDIEDELSRVYMELEVLKRKQMEAENPHIAVSPKHSLSAKAGTQRKSSASNNNNKPQISVSHDGAAVPLLLNYSINDASPTSIAAVDVGGGSSKVLLPAVTALHNDLLTQSVSSAVADTLPEPPVTSISTVSLPPPSGSTHARCTCGATAQGAGSGHRVHRYAVTAAAVRKIFLNIDDLKQATPV